jgi:hypothetical protein
VRFPILLASGVVLLLCGCSSPERGTPCDGETHARQLAGDEVIDCGVVRVGGDPSPVHACVLEAFRAGQAFVARYDRSGIDAAVALFLVFRDGTYSEVTYIGAGGCDVCRASVGVAVCNDPVETDTLPPPDGGARADSPISCATTPERQTVCE